LNGAFVQPVFAFNPGYRASFFPVLPPGGRLSFTVMQWRPPGMALLKYIIFW
jgi:hypothetical protein